MASSIDIWHSAILTAIFYDNPSDGNSTVYKNLPATSIKASLGQGWNQSITVELMIPGNFLDLTLITSPTGEKQRTTFSYILILSKK